ncbi:hypothetical protein [Trichothermofontia sp.]
MAIDEISKNMVGAAGEYYVCAELCRRNILALITPKNNPLFDIIATDPLGIKTVSIQVKTMSLQNKQGWRLNTDICTKRQNPNLFVVLVNLKTDQSNDYYIYEYDVLSERVSEVYSEYIKQPKRDGGKRQDVSFRWFDLKNFNDEDYKRMNRWEILGFENISPQG